MFQVLFCLSQGVYILIRETDNKLVMQETGREVPGGKMRLGAISPRVHREGLAEKVPSKERSKSFPSKGNSQGNSSGM